MQLLLEVRTRFIEIVEQFFTLDDFNVL